MKFTTIWTIRAMDVSERVRRTADLGMQKVASNLPQRVKYWVFIQQGAKHIHGGEIAPEVAYTTILSRIDQGRRA